MYADDGNVFGFMNCQGKFVKIALYIAQLLTAVAVMSRYIQLNFRKENYFKKYFLTSLSDTVDSTVDVRFYP